MVYIMNDPKSVTSKAIAAVYKHSQGALEDIYVNATLSIKRIHSAGFFCKCIQSYFMHSCVERKCH